MFIAAQAQLTEEGREMLMDAAESVGGGKPSTGNEEQATNSSHTTRTQAVKEPEIGSYEALMATFGAQGGFMRADA